MGMEQKTARLKQAFPFAEIKQFGSRLLIKHNLDAARSGISPKLISSLAKNIAQLGDGFDLVFTTSRLNTRRRVDPSDQIETLYYTSMVTGDGTVHQIKTARSTFPDEFKEVCVDIFNQPVKGAQGFIGVGQDGSLNYFITSQASSLWQELFLKMFLHKQTPEKNIAITLSLARPADENSRGVLVTASDGKESLSIVLNEQSALALRDTMEKSHGAVNFFDMRSAQKSARLD